MVLPDNYAKQSNLFIAVTKLECAIIVHFKKLMQHGMDVRIVTNLWHPCMPLQVLYSFIACLSGYISHPLFSSCICI